MAGGKKGSRGLDDGEAGTIPWLLRVLGDGAGGPILMALGEGALRTMQLTDRISGHSPRSVYRYAEKLETAGVVERQEEPGVPSYVIYRLTEPAGRELYELVNAYADASLGRLGSGAIGAQEWAALAALADLWETGMIEELSRRPLTPGELSRGAGRMSVHQVTRRGRMLTAEGMIGKVSGGDGRRCYRLTRRARRATALFAGLGRWQRHAVPAGEVGITAARAAGLLRAAAPLVEMRGDPGRSLMLAVEENEDWVVVDAEGSVTVVGQPPEPVDAAADGGVGAWLEVLVGGKLEGIGCTGDEALMEIFLRRLHRMLWEPEPS